MRIIRKVLRMGGIWLVLGVCLWAAGAACLNMVAGDSSAVRVSMRYAPNAAPAFGGIAGFYNELESRRDEPPQGRLTAWAEKRGGSIASSEWNANASIDVFYVDGDVQQVMPLLLMAGGFPDRADAQGAAVDVETAVKLFGSTEPIGLQATLDGQEIIIRGVFEKPKGLLSWGMDTGRGMVVTSAAGAAASDSKGVGVQGAEITLPAGLSPDEAKQAANQLAGEMGLGGAAVVWEHSGDTALLGQALQLPGWIMMATAAWMMLRAALSCGSMLIRLGYRRARSRIVPVRVARNTLIRALIFPMVLLAAGAGIIWVVRPSFYLPPAYIPTQWSDTGFWVELVKKSMLEHAQRGVLTTPRPDAMQQALTNTGIFFVVAAVACMILLGSALAAQLGPVVYKRLRRRADDLPQPPRVWDGAAFGCMMLLAAALPVVGMLLSGQLGLVPSPAGSIWAMQTLPALYIAVQVMMRLWPSVLWPLRFSPGRWFAKGSLRGGKKGSGGPTSPNDGKKKRFFPRLKRDKKTEAQAQPLLMAAWVQGLKSRAANAAHVSQQHSISTHAGKTAKGRSSMPPARRRRGA